MQQFPSHDFPSSPHQGLHFEDVCNSLPAHPTLVPVDVGSCKRLPCVNPRRRPPVGLCHRAYRWSMRTSSFLVASWAPFAASSIACPCTLCEASSSRQLGRIFRSARQGWPPKSLAGVTRGRTEGESSQAMIPRPPLAPLKRRDTRYVDSSLLDVLDPLRFALLVAHRDEARTMRVWP